MAEIVAFGCTEGILRTIRCKLVAEFIFSSPFVKSTAEPLILTAVISALDPIRSVNVEAGLAILCAVGDNLRNDPRIAARVIGALEEFPVRMVSQAASRRNVTIVLRDADLACGMGRLHGEFFG